MITQAELKELFDYNAETGVFTWKVKLRNGMNIGDVAGTKDSNGYLVVAYKRKRYYCHRLAWTYIYGDVPNIIDHIDGDKSNNKINNLRNSTYTENARNQKISKNNISGIKSVGWVKSRNKWVVKLRVNGKQKFIGHFDDLELAELVAIEARIKYHGEFANHG